MHSFCVSLLQYSLQRMLSAVQQILQLHLLCSITLTMATLVKSANGAGGMPLCREVE